MSMAKTNKRDSSGGASSTFGAHPKAKEGGVMTQKTNEGKMRIGGLFEDLSMAQVLAGALAAVTSMLLASRIGIAGSVIGVAVGSIVSAVASQLYKKFLLASAEKLKNLGPGETGEVAGAEASSEADALVKVEPPTEAGAASDGRDRQVLADGETHTIDPFSTRVMDRVPLAVPTTVRASRTLRVDDEALQGDVTVQRVRAMRERKQRLQRRVVAASALSAVVAVLVSAAVVNFATMGEGLGTKTSPIATTTWSQPNDGLGGSSSSSGSSNANASGQGTESDNAAPEHSAPSGTGGSATDNAGGGQQGSTGSTGSTGSSGSGSGSTTGGNQSGGTSGTTKPDAGGSTSGSGGGSGSSGGSSGSGSGSGGGSGSESGSTSGSGTGSSSGSTSGSASAPAASTTTNHVLG